MKLLFSWGVTSFVVALAISIAFAFVGTNDFGFAKICFWIAATYAIGGIVVGFLCSGWTPVLQSITIFLCSGVVGLALFGSMRYVDIKQKKAAPLPSLATPVIMWADPAPIVVGTSLSKVQLNATISVEGVTTYNPKAGTVLPEGNHILTATFVPKDAKRYQSATQTVQLFVQPRPPRQVAPRAPVAPVGVEPPPPQDDLLNEATNAEKYCSDFLSDYRASPIFRDFRANIGEQQEQLGEMNIKLHPAWQ